MVILNDNNIHNAVFLWRENEEKAKQIYGEIHDWDVLNVKSLLCF